MRDVTRKSQNVLFGVLFMILASFCFAAIAILGKLVEETVSVFQLAGVQNCTGLICMATTVLVRGGWRGFRTHHFTTHLIRDVAGGLGFLCFFLALPYIPVTDAVVLLNTGPLMIPFVAWIWLRKRVSFRLCWGTVVGFVGVVVILEPGLNGFHPAMIAALLSGVAMAVSAVAIHLLIKTESIDLILFYFFLIATVISLPLAIWQWRPAGAIEWLFMLLVGVAMLGLQLSISLALGYRSAIVLAPLIYLTIIWSALLDWWIWSKVPSGLTALGIVLVVVGGLLSLWLAKRR